VQECVLERKPRIVRLVESIQAFERFGLLSRFDSGYDQTRRRKGFPVKGEELRLHIKMKRFKMKVPDYPDYLAAHRLFSYRVVEPHYINRRFVENYLGGISRQIPRKETPF